MPVRRRVWLLASFASALLLLAGSSCTPDERNLGLGRSANARNDAGNGSSAAGARELAGAAGSDAEESAAGESGAAGATVSGNGGTSGWSAAGGSSGTGGSTSAIGGTGGASNGGSAGAPFAGPCTDMDNNGVDDCSETLVLNSRFDSDVEHWTSAQWNPQNASPKTPSGSLLVSNDSPVQPDAGYELTAAEQCIQVIGDIEYQVAARVMIPPGQGGGFGGFNLWIFANDGCEGTFVTGLSPATTQETNAWTVVSAKFKMPTAARSMSVRLAATRPFAQPKLQVLFDDVLVKLKAP